MNIDGTELDWLGVGRWSTNTPDYDIFNIFEEPQPYYYEWRHRLSYYGSIHPDLLINWHPDGRIVFYFRAVSSIHKTWPLEGGPLEHGSRQILRKVWGIAIMNADGTGKRLIVRGKPHETVEDILHEYPWRRIASHKEGEYFWGWLPSFSSTGELLYIKRSVDGKWSMHIHRKGYYPTDDMPWPVWSPDGKKNCFLPHSPRARRDT
jgi:hypothetical protein